MSTIADVVLTELAPHADERGAFTELFRNSWPVAVAPVQWNFVSSRANVLRGFHVHVTHGDYLTCVSGELFVGLKDLRVHSPTHGRTETHLLRGESPLAISIPPGVAHGFYCARPSQHVYAVSEYWNVEDELACRWDDPEIGIDWPATSPALSRRDQEAGTLEQMIKAFVARSALHAPALA